MPKPILTIMTKILANERLRQDINSANTTRPFAKITKALCKKFGHQDKQINIFHTAIKPMKINTKNVQQKLDSNWQNCIESNL